MDNYTTVRNVRSCYTMHSMRIRLVVVIQVPP